MKKLLTCSEAGRKGGLSKSKKKMESFKKNASKRWPKAKKQKRVDLGGV